MLLVPPSPDIPEWLDIASKGCTAVPDFLNQGNIFALPLLIRKSFRTATELHKSATHDLFFFLIFILAGHSRATQEINIGPL